MSNQRGGQSQGHIHNFSARSCGASLHWACWISGPGWDCYGLISCYMYKDLPLAH